MSILFSKSKCAFLVMAQPHCWCSRAQWSLGTGSWRSWMMSTNRCKSTKIKKILWLFVGNRLSHILVVEFRYRASSSSSSNCSRQIRVSNYKRILLLLSNGWHWHSGLLDPKHVFFILSTRQMESNQIGAFFLFQILPVVGLCAHRLRQMMGRTVLVAGMPRFLVWCVSFFFFLFALRNKRRKKTGHQCHSANRPL